MEVIVNGQCRALEEGVRVLELLESLGTDPGHVAVERNSEIVRRSEFAETRLTDGDVIEVVRFVAGG